MTEQRALLLDIFRVSKCERAHRTAEELLLLAREKMPGISRATVYNNLRSMENEGLIRKISGDFGSDYYDASVLPHAHLVCTECRRVYDVDTPGLDEWLSSCIGEEISAYELKIKNICPLCKTK